MRKILYIISLLMLCLSLFLIAQTVQDHYVVTKTTEAAVETYQQELCYDDHYETEITEDVLKMEDTYENQEIGYVYIPETNTYSPFVTGTPYDVHETAMDDGSTAADNAYYLPGEGNHIIASGHRNLHMQDLYELEVGDPIVVVVGANTFVYEVTSIDTIDETDNAAVFYETDTEVLTLYTCYPREYLSQITGRYVVNAELVEKSTVECSN